MLWKEISSNLKLPFDFQHEISLKENEQLMDTLSEEDERRILMQLKELATFMIFNFLIF
jgi:hypothetical protein